MLWINDAVLGVRCLGTSTPAVHDVTDDWRTFEFLPRVARRLVRAEDRLAEAAATVVCSQVLQERWQQRYGVPAEVVHNGVDEARWSAAVPEVLPGRPPHVGYVGTLHEERLNVDLVRDVADLPAVGTLHLIGPDSLGAAAGESLRRHPKIRMGGPVPSHRVAGCTKGLDVVLSPHVLSPFTLSLDAIKSYEYLASGRPIVATPTSGFQLMDEPGLAVVAPGAFPAAVASALAAPQGPITRSHKHDWSARARQFGECLRAAVERGPAASPAQRAHDHPASFGHDLRRKDQ